MSNLLQDIRFSWRLLTGRRLSTATTILTLALGLGVCAAVFTVVDGLLLQPLPYEEPEDLVVLWETQPGRETTWKVASLPMAEDWRLQVPEVEDLAANRPWRPILARGDLYESLRGAKVGASFFDLLGVRPLLGRSFTPADDRPGAPQVVVLSHALWQRHFGGDPEVIGRPVQLDDVGTAVVAEIVGVLPPRPAILPPVVFEEAEIWTPLALDPLQEARGQRMYRVLARLAPGATLATLEQRLEMVAEEVARIHPKSNEAWGGAAEHLIEQTVAQVRPALLALLLAVVFVYLVACTNTGVLQLVKEAARGKEIATRLALGASPFCIGRQLFCEMLLLTGAGCVAGLLMAQGILKLLSSLSVEAWPPGQEMTMGLRVVVVAGGMALSTALVFGGVQTLRASRSNIRAALRTERGGLGGGGWLRRSLVLAEITWSLILLVAAGLMLRSFDQLMEVDPGFDAERVLTLRIESPASLQPTGFRLEQLFGDLLETARGFPGVRSVGLVDHLPLQGVARSTVAGLPSGARSDFNPRVEFRGISAGYFQSMSIPMLAGHDLNGSLSGTQVLVNATAVELLWDVPPEDVVGREVHLAWGDGSRFRVVGVVGDVRGHNLREKARPAVYLPFVEVPHRSMTLVVRTGMAPEHLVEELVAWGRDEDHVMVIDQVQTLREVIYSTTAQPRAYTLLLTGFALISLLLTAGGTYSVVSYSVMQRRKDWGVRLALGAQPRDLVRRTVAEGISEALVGILFGLFGSLLLTRLLSGLLFGISVTDPWTLLGTVSLMLAVVLLASYIPARRAIRLDPVSALRRV